MKSDLERAREIFKYCIIPRFCPEDCNCRIHHKEIGIPGSIIDAVAKTLSEVRAEEREKAAIIAEKTWGVNCGTAKAIRNQTSEGGLE